MLRFGTSSLVLLELEALLEPVAEKSHIIIHSVDVEVWLIGEYQKPEIVYSPSIIIT